VTFHYIATLLNVIKYRLLVLSDPKQLVVAYSLCDSSFTYHGNGNAYANNVLSIDIEYYKATILSCNTNSKTSKLQLNSIGMLHPILVGLPCSRRLKPPQNAHHLCTYQWSGDGLVCVLYASYHMEHHLTSSIGLSVRSS
jgi:hypothetical protein